MSTLAEYAIITWKVSRAELSTVWKHSKLISNKKNLFFTNNSLLTKPFLCRKLGSFSRRNELRALPREPVERDNCEIIPKCAQQLGVCERTFGPNADTKRRERERSVLLRVCKRCNDHFGRCDIFGRNNNYRSVTSLVISKLDTFFLTCLLLWSLTSFDHKIIKVAGAKCELIHMTLSKPKASLSVFGTDLHLDKVFSLA